MDAQKTWRDWLRQVLTLTRREAVDSMRDWRILAPIVVLTLAFPLLMNLITVSTQNMFYERWGIAGIETRLIPLMLMVVGFFPVSVSLIIALETFVGEKERRSLEPLLATPLSDLQLYLGKTLAAMLLPLVAGCLGISVYVIVLWRQGWQATPTLLLQIVLLTAAEALVMVSGAVVVSSQTTSVRAANLLASFIIIPMALLVQGESLVILQAGNTVLWYILLFLIVTDVMLVRMGLRLFNREELLGREIDELNVGSLWRTFRRHLGWERWWFGRDPQRLPRSLRWLGTGAGLYLREVPQLLRRSGLAILLVVVALAGSVLVGRYFAVRFRLPAHFLAFETISAESFDSLATANWLPAFTTWGVLSNNSRSLLAAGLLGTFSFGALAIALLMAPLAIIAYVAYQAAWAGYSPWLFLLTFVLPHGILELPAATLATAMAVRLGAAFIAPPKGMTVGEGWLQALADFVKLFVAVVLPLLAVAAWIEVHVTPALVLLVYGQ
ncbi:MAG: stage II sporulation protein M [Anaerolineae bacterium]|nr:stage II sporulation protein M [Anaerolineae bacterium]